MSLKYLILYFLILFQNINTQFTLIIDSADTSRAIDGVFERGLTIQCAQAIKEQLAQCNKTINVVTTRSNTEHNQKLDSVIFANRMQPNLYIKLGFYPEASKPCHWALYYYQQDSSDVWHKANTQLFYSVKQAHLLNLNTNKIIAEKFFKTLQNPNSKTSGFEYGLFAVPIKPLFGIQSVSLYFEAGLHHATDWKLFVDPLCQAILSVIS